MKIFITIITTFSCLLSSAQIHQKKMFLFATDAANTVINVFDIKKEVLLKSFNVGDLIKYTCLNTDQTKFYALTDKFVSIIDVNTLEIKKIRLIFDEDKNSNCVLYTKYPICER